MLRKRYVTIPRSISLIDPETDQPIVDLDPLSGLPTTNPPTPVSSVTFLDFIKRCLLRDPRLADDYAVICASARICDAINNATNGILTLEEDDWLMLNRVIDNPERFENGVRKRGYAYYNPLLMLQLKPFLDAIKLASSEKLVENS